MSIEIKRWTDGKVLYVAENASDIRTALEEAVAAGAKLQYAKLQGAKLQYAKLQGAKLQYAKLQGAKLQGAELQGAKLQYAKLQGAKLQYAKLQGAKLQYAKLQGAELQYAKLQYAELQYAKPSDPLYPIKIDFWAVLDQAPAEVAGLRMALVEGRVDGSTYTGACACLVGTIANVRDVPVDSDELGIPCDADRPAEVWFVPIRKGHRAVVDPSQPVEGEGPWRASMALRWLDEWVELRKKVGAVLLGAAA
jgi:hypothetical protein